MVVTTVNHLYAPVCSNESQARDAHALTWRRHPARSPRTKVLIVWLLDAESIANWNRRSSYYGSECYSSRSRLRGNDLTRCYY